MFRGVIVDITISCRSFVFHSSQSGIEIPTILCYVERLAVGELNLVSARCQLVTDKFGNVVIGLPRKSKRLPCE